MIHVYKCRLSWKVRYSSNREHDSQTCHNIYRLLYCFWFVLLDTCSSYKYNFYSSKWTVKSYLACFEVLAGFKSISAVPFARLSLLMIKCNPYFRQKRLLISKKNTFGSSWEDLWLIPPKTRLAKLLRVENIRKIKTRV